MSFPAKLAAYALRNLDVISEQCDDFSFPKSRQHELECVVAVSDFVTEALARDAHLRAALPTMLEDSERKSQYRRALATALNDCRDEAQGMTVLREFRRREMVYIAWRDVMASWSVPESLSHLSQLAEAMIIETYHWQYQLCCQLWGTPCNAKGEAQPMLIIGMGKLGGGELNFSSDIDLIFTYPENGETQGARRALANAQFFTRLGQRIIKSLDQHTVDGFCYRVDMRLRPFGESGPLVMSFAALEDYYQEQGRDWERYAMVKARAMGQTDSEHYLELQTMLRPFVFRRYIDFSAIQSLRRMKSMIRAEVRRRGLTNNIKLGAGGIREIEFIAQVFQLIRGGREPSLCQRGLLATLSAIEELQLLAAQEVSQLKAAYLFLRRLENVMQAIDDKQTQTLPDNEQDQTRLAWVMGCEDWPALYADIQAHMQQVHDIFDGLIGDSHEATEDEVEEVYAELWHQVEHRDALHLVLSSLCEPVHQEALCDDLIHFQQDINKKTLGPRGREVLNRLMPKVFEQVFAHPEAPFGLARVLHLLRQIVTRTTYLELLDEHPMALKQLVRLCTASPMISEQLARYPILLDELIDPQQLYIPVALDCYHSELRDFMARIPEDDMEQQMEGLRQFKQICMLRIAAADVAGALSVMKVSDHLTYLAEAVIEAVVAQAWLQVKEKYGEPQHLSLHEGQSRGFAVVGYGKVGGWELGYHSDLDLVFIHDCPSSSETSGVKRIDSRQFYLRLAQRIVHLFSTRTPSGVLYEVDMRLRPSGASGLLVSPIESFAEYQQQEAWTWEHQAMVRSRVVYGHSPLREQFEQVRRQVLSLPRDGDALRTAVYEMRKKMRSHLANKKTGRFMLKQDQGGITDIEFLAQYLVLRFSCQYPSLATWSDNVRIFESLASEGLVAEHQAQQLISAYTTMRNEIHRRNLLDLSTDVAPDKFAEQRQWVIEAWNAWFDELP
ncbi:MULTISPECIES: bifunctional [glutamate--ammonia ligase]-adenylyl-L-tyrosine phosphorylase/[glutamate--ammonia-ligase] adenylyltransferase [unclassified Vibrio]|uniref:Bifunctional glutamine synthetase adenylyltransferase/adenylyl-removing enzyme n=1 Tax=Vibrio sp. HB236076 TaxID=3232307 RepID=A0AB39HIL1_9VIBR|nr:bifunctional [glutamate--ammonia ligase]-adenylyl-L-tyrosine phosphorylase/[glutamate--ammonia-ligase] adenylyltransferase [Vibrio sp. HB161653]MDP5254515.1 bifunctional [glutamate--ammonia ligase]-adenylyl-L-tyrosine phosphorylase/[glutamate--ammonia-ligase] adenylyltransferase [Vibrio sp. HB161653]